MSVKASVASIALSGCPEAGAIRCRPEVAGRMSDAPQLQKLEEIVERAEGASLMESNSPEPVGPVNGWEVDGPAMRHVDGTRTPVGSGAWTKKSFPGPTILGQEGRQEYTLWGEVLKAGSAVQAYWWKILSRTPGTTFGPIHTDHLKSATQDAQRILQFNNKPLVKLVNGSEEPVLTQTVFGSGELAVDVQAMAAVQRPNTRECKKVFFAFRHVNSQVIEAYMIKEGTPGVNYKMVKADYNPDTNKFSER